MPSFGRMSLPALFAELKDEALMSNGLALWLLSDRRGILLKKITANTAQAEECG
jgi:hypothetical protein